MDKISDREKGNPKGLHLYKYHTGESGGTRSLFFLTCKLQTKIRGSFIEKKA